MTWVAVAVVGGTVVGGAIAAHGAQQAADTQAGAAANAQQISQNEFNTITQQNQPFMQSGYGALSELDYLLGIPGSNGPAGGAGTQPNPGMQQNPWTQPNPSQPMPYAGSAPGQVSGANPGLYHIGAGYDPAAGYMGPAPPGALISGPSTPAPGAPPGGSPTGQPAPGTHPGGGFGSLLQPFTADTFKQYSPAYQFQKEQGLQGVLNADTSGQGALSGATQKDLISFNQNLANTSFNNAFNQYQTQQGNIFNRLSGIAQLGQASANNTGQQGTALAGQAAQSATNIGTAQAAGQIGSANAISGAISSAAPWLAYGGGGGGTVSGGFGYNPSGNAAAVDPATGADYSAWSDRRLKTDIVQVDRMPSGLPIYRFRYTFAPGFHVGVMADEALRLFPEAVRSLMGLLRVDYARIG